MQRHFQYLIAYMQCTSLDGEPTLFDKLMVGWLRFVRPCGINERMQIPKIKSVSLGILKFGLSVGFSGFLLSLVVWVFSRGEPQDVFIKGESPDVVHEQGLIVRELSKQSRLLETMQSNLMEIKDRLSKPTVSASPQKVKIDRTN
ncbi:hypothetical protein DIE16_32045 [Burkholderia sp. Bp9090]|nr:hypothetical protein DIE16_32045 [Burkholderia sp. Bp9090]